MIPINENHVEEGQALVLDRFKSGAVLGGILKALLNQVQALEDALQDITSERWLTTAVGAQLDALGQIVGEYRDGREDEDYRFALTLRIRINRSQGRVLDIFEVLNLLAPISTFIYRENYPAGFEVEQIEPLTAERLRIIVRALKQTKAIATYGTFVHIEDDDDSGVFSFSDDGDDEDDEIGFEDTDADTGGELLSVTEF